MRMIIFYFIAIEFMCIFFAKESFAGRYVNDEYGFSVDIPSGVSFCESEPNQHDHGIVIFLDEEFGGCSSIEGRQSISIYGDYNAEFHRNPKDAVAIFCYGNFSNVKIPKKYIPINSAKYASCSVKRGEKWIDVYIVAQSGSWPRKFAKNKIPYINYTIHIHIPRDGFSATMKHSMNIINSINVFYKNNSGEPKNSTHSRP